MIIPGVVANQITSVPIWTTTASTAYVGTVQLNTGSLNTTAVTTALTAQYPPENYINGYVMRCRIYSIDGSSYLGQTYRIRSNT